MPYKIDSYFDEDLDGWEDEEDESSMIKCLKKDCQVCKGEDECAMGGWPCTCNSPNDWQETKIRELYPCEKMNFGDSGLIECKHCEKLEKKEEIITKPVRTQSQRLRFLILSKHNFTCQYCGSKAPEVKLEIDHIIPLSRGGLDVEENLTTACEDCNRGKLNEFIVRPHGS